MSEIKNYYRPESLEEALQLVNRPLGNVAILAGGTASVPGLGDETEALVDLQSVGLDAITAVENGLMIGAMVRLHQLCEHPDIPPVIQQAALYEGPNTFRHAATVGGIVVDTDWESELFAALLVHEARVTVQGLDGVEEVMLSNFSKSDLGRRIVTTVTIRVGGDAAHERLARTPKDRPIVAVIGRRLPDGKKLFAFCGVSHKPILVEMENLSGLKPPSDFRGSSDYRQEVAGILARRALQRLT